MLIHGFHIGRRFARRCTAQLSSNFSWIEQDRGCMEYIDRIWKLQFKEWKYELHKYYKSCPTLKALRGTLLRSFWRGWASGTEFGTHFESEKYKDFGVSHAPQKGKERTNM